MEPIIHEIISKITSSFNEELEKLVKESRDISVFTIVLQL